MTRYLKVCLSIFITLFFFLFSGHLALAQADDLIIQPDGSVLLIITSPVLAASSDKIEEVKNIIGQILVAPAYAQNTVDVNPKPTKDKKIEVTVKTHSQSSQPAKEEKKNVDQIVAQGSDKKTIFTIKPNSSGQVTITQGNNNASTPLPLTIDTQSKSVSTQINNNSVKIQVLPNDVVKTVTDKGYINQNISPSETISLNQQGSDAVYQISGNREAKIFNLIDFRSPVTVVVSAQTGRTVNVSQPFIFSVIDLFRR